MTGASLFSEKDRAMLDLIHPQLAIVVYLAAERCPIRLDVIEGLRSERRQVELVRAGASRTMHSRHLTGHAVDLAPMVDGHTRWDWPLFFPIAAAMRYAAIKMAVPMRWGGIWDRHLSQLPEHANDIEAAQAEYVTRCRADGQRPFLDGPHFEIPFNASGYA